MITNLFFTEPYLDRLSLMREDEKQVETILPQASSRFIIGCNDQLLMQQEGPHRPVLFSYSEIKNLVHPNNNLVLLGKVGMNCFFLLEIEDESNLPSLKGGTFMNLRPVRGKLDKAMASVSGYANAILHWHHRNKFCRDCGSPTKMRKIGHERQCLNPDCQKHHFPRTDPAVIVAVNSSEGLLMARQPHWPKKMFSIIAGFVEPGESLEQSVVREVWEETGISIAEVQYQASQPWPFPSSIMLGYTAEAITTDIKLLDKELETGSWFSRERISDEVISGTLKLPTATSISFQLVKQWFNKEKGYDLMKLLER